jgi:hypothetical protein
MTPVLLRRTLLGSLQAIFAQHPFSTGNTGDIQDVVSVLFSLITMTHVLLQALYLYMFTTLKLVSHLFKQVCNRAWKCLLIC